jgi:hypothetical protein
MGARKPGTALSIEGAGAADLIDAGEVGRYPPKGVHRVNSPRGDRRIGRTVLAGLGPGFYVQGPSGCVGPWGGRTAEIACSSDPAPTAELIDPGHHLHHRPAIAKRLRDESACCLTEPGMSPALVSLHLGLD